MTDARPCLHHVVFCVERAHQDDAATLWKDLGFELIEIDLPDVGLRVLLDWTRGIEIISPSDVNAAEGARVQQFLNERGEGVYSIVVLTNDIDGPLSVAARYGATLQLRQDRSGDGFALEEAMLSPVYGMPITFIATDMPAQRRRFDVTYPLETFEDRGFASLVSSLQLDVTPQTEWTQWKQSPDQRHSG